MEQKVCNYCKFNNDNEQIDDFEKKIALDAQRDAQKTGFRPMEIYDLNFSLFQALISPDKFKHIRMPAPFYIPSKYI